MQYKEKQVESFFEDEELLGDIANKYFIVKQNLQKAKKPPHELNFIKEFQTQYSMVFTVEEIELLKDFMDNDYEGYAIDKMMHENKNAINIMV